MIYAKIIEGAIAAYFVRPEAIPADQIKHVDGLPMARPVVDEDPPAYNAATQRIVQTVTIEDARVVRSWTIEDLTSTEIADRARAQALAQIQATDTGMARVLEDVISALLSSGAIEWDDLPTAARDRLDSRAALREAL